METSDNVSCGAGMPLHFDKDETMHAVTGRYVHPVLATVTYISDGANQAPTVVLPIHVSTLHYVMRVDFLTRSSCFLLFFPVCGLSFDSLIVHA